MTLPLVFYYLINLTSSKLLMKQYVNSAFQKNFSIAATVVIFFASILTLAAAIFNF
jgi:Mn2+/Fe2+ NRAMP family transporter